MQLPKVIFIDAVGTLFGVRNSVGQVYGEIAGQFGVEVSPDKLDRAFYNSFKQSNKMAFPGVDPKEIRTKEFEWWRAIAYQTFQDVGVLNQFSDFASFFAELYAHFATEKPWFVYPDVLPALKRWRELKIEIGIISNFDTRIYPVLEALNLAEYFTSVTISTEVGAAKPELEIFNVALQKHNCPPEAAWHIGDSYKEDYQGAKAAGLRGIWLKRSEIL